MAIVINGERAYVGRVLATGELNYHDDSDFYAIVLKDDGAIARIDDGTTRYAAPPTAHADATDPEVLAQAEAALADYVFERLKFEAAADAKEIAVGKRVRVTAGRKLDLGTEATVFWLGWNSFQPRYANSYSAKRPGNEDRVGVTLDDGTRVFGSKYNFEVADPGDEFVGFDALRAKAARIAKRHNWRLVGAGLTGTVFV